MDVATMNNIGIMVCATAAVAMFYWIGRDHEEKTLGDRTPTKEKSREEEK